jgi:hypothetical protein
MARNTMTTLVARKTLGTIILWGTVGLISVLALFHVAFGAAA